MPKVMNRMAEFLARKERIEGRRITKRLMAEETGLSESSLKSWARNDVLRFDSTHIATICKYLGCTVGELLVIVESDDQKEGSAALPVAV